MPAELEIRRATEADAAAAARLLHQFNSEFGDRTPGVAVLADRYAPLIAGGEVTVLLGGGGPDGFAQLRYRPSLISGALDAHLEELYVVPEQRGHGLGRALLDAAMRTARGGGATRMDLGTSVDDVAARALYESAGFTNNEGAPDGPAMLVYERDL